MKSENREKELFCAYLNHTDVPVEIIDINGQVIKGYVSGIYLDSSNGNFGRIQKWHIVQKRDRLNLGLYPLGYMRGILVPQKEVRCIRFGNGMFEFNFEK